MLPWLGSCVMWLGTAVATLAGTFVFAVGCGTELAYDFVSKATILFGDSAGT